MSRALILLAGLAALACGPRRPAPSPDADPVPCSEASGPLAADATADGLQGVYRLELVAVRGERAGDTTTADLELVPAADSLQTPPGTAGLRDSTTRYALIGWTTVRPTAIGATETGALDSHDPAAPGVLVMERRTRRPEAPREIMLRLGADANRRDRLRFDGGYFALTVLRIDPAGFAGTWASAAGLPAAGGHFCAQRVSQ